MGLIILGIVLIVFQLISLSGNIATGNLNFFSEVPNVQAFFFDLAYFIGYFLVGIIGIVLLISGIITLIKENKERPAAKTETTTREYNSYQSLLNENSEAISIEETPNIPEPIETVAPNIKPNKKIKSKKPLIIVTYVLLFSVIISLSVFCILYVTEKENAVSQLESDNRDLQNEIQKLQADQMIIEYDMKNLESEVDRLNDAIESKDNNIGNLDKQINDYKTESEILKKQINNYKAEAELWKNKFMNSDPTDVTYSYEFSSVNALITAIKKDPEAYHNKQVKVFGMILTCDKHGKTEKIVNIFDYKEENVDFSTSSGEALYLMLTKDEAKELIKVNLSSDLQYTVAETGDYVNLYGIVRITNGEIYLDKCQYN